MSFLYRMVECTNQKTREAVRNVSVSLVIKGIAMVTMLFSMPLHMEFFDNNIVLGIWYTLLSVLSWVNMFDFGLANGLRNNLVEPITHKNHQKISEYISSTLYMLTIISILLFVCFYLLVYLFDINTIFNVSSSIITVDCMRQVVEILLIGIAVSFVLKTITSVNYALQLSFINDINAFCGSVIPLIIILLLRRLEITIEKKLIIMAVTHVLAICLPPMLSFLIIKIKHPLMRSVKISFRNVAKKASNSISGLGITFLLAQCTFLIITQTNEYLISVFFKPDYIVEFKAYNTIFLVIGSVFQVSLAPIWSSITKASVQKDYAWILKLKKLLYAVSILAILANFAVVPFTSFIFDTWLGTRTIVADHGVALIFAIYGGIYTYNIVITTIANGLGKLSIQIIVYTSGAVVKIPIVYFFSKLFPDYWLVVIFVNEVILFAFCLTQTIWFQKYFKIKKNDD